MRDFLCYKLEVRTFLNQLDICDKHGINLSRSQNVSSSTHQEYVMTLSQKDLIMASLVADMFVRNKSKEELSHFAQGVGVPEKRREAIKSLCEIYANVRGVKVEDVNTEFAGELIRRILANINFRFGELRLSPEPPPSEEIDAMCET